MSNAPKDPFNNWLESPDGLTAKDITTMPQSNPRSAEFLENRLWNAFYEGYGVRCKELSDKNTQPAVDGAHYFSSEEIVVLVGSWILGRNVVLKEGDMVDFMIRLNTLLKDKINALYTDKNVKSKPCCQATLALALKYVLGQVEICPVCKTPV